jgi:hypothetical protein
MQKDQIIQYPLRPLWIGLEMQKALYEALKNGCSTRFFAKIRELGCNALILGGFDHEQIGYAELNEQLNIIRPALIQENIKCIVKLKSPSKPKEIECDYLFWISQYTQTIENNKTFSERLQEEMNAAEKMIENRSHLIFYVPFDKGMRGWHNPHLLRDLCLAAGKGTTLAFSAVAGHPAYDHLPRHPFLAQLQRQKEQHSTPLLPIINTGSLCQGEGLWPSISFDLFESSCMRDARRQFTGFISMANRLPADQGFLDCNLWVAGQIQSKNDHPDALIEAWFLSKLPEVDYSKFREVLKSIRNTIVDLSYLRHLPEECSYTPEEKRLLVDHLMGNLKVIHMKSDKMSLNPLQEQILIFIRDAKRMLLHISQSHRIDLSLSLEDGDLQDSFWTKTIGSSSHRDGLQISILDKPHYGPIGSPSYEIYHQTIYL